MLISHCRLLARGHPRVMSLTLFLISYFGLLQESATVPSPACSSKACSGVGVGGRRRRVPSTGTLLILQQPPPHTHTLGLPSLRAGCPAPPKTRPRQTHLQSISRLAHAGDWWSRFWIHCRPLTPAAKKIVFYPGARQNLSVSRFLPLTVADSKGRAPHLGPGTLVSFYSR